MGKKQSAWVITRLTKSPQCAECTPPDSTVSTKAFFFPITNLDIYSCQGRGNSAFRQVEWNKKINVISDEIMSEAL